MAGVRRLRGVQKLASFGSTLDHRGIAPRSQIAATLTKAIGRLRAAEKLPLDSDSCIEFWGAERCWAHRFTSSLWLYYRVDPSNSDERIILMAVHDHLHMQ